MKKTQYEIQNEYEEKILDLIYHFEDLTTSDLQGAVEAIVMNIINESKKL